MNSFLKGQEILIAKTAACHGNWSFKTVLGMWTLLTQLRKSFLSAAGAMRVNAFTL